MHISFPKGVNYSFLPHLSFFFSKYIRILNGIAFSTSLRPLLCHILFDCTGLGLFVNRSKAWQCPCCPVP